MLFRIDRATAVQFGIDLRAARRASGDTRAGLGARCTPRISQHRLSLIEQNRARLRPAEVVALCAALPALKVICVLRRPSPPNRVRRRRRDSLQRRHEPDHATDADSGFARPRAGF